MGFFTNYSKPGKGISKEEAAKRNYFDILGRHVFDFMKLNLLFVGCNIIFILAAVLFTFPYLKNIDQVIDALIMSPQVLLPPLPFVPFLFMGPFIAGLTYVLRNWSRQEHAFLVSDFFEHSKKNWKQGLALSIINTVVSYLYLTAMIFYLKNISFTMLVLLVGGIVGLVLLMMNFYTYPMIVTFDMKLKDIIKNSWIFAMGKLPQNLFFLIVIGGVHILLLWYLPIVWAFAMVLILIAWSGYTINYYVWHVMNKHMMPKVEENKADSVFDDERKEG